jgi:hypothetical protein
MADNRRITGEEILERWQAYPFELVQAMLSRELVALDPKDGLGLQKKLINAFSVSMKSYLVTVQMFVLLKIIKGQNLDIFVEMIQMKGCILCFVGIVVLIFCLNPMRQKMKCQKSFLRNGWNTLVLRLA